MNLVHSFVEITLRTQSFSCTSNTFSFFSKLPLFKNNWIMNPYELYGFAIHDGKSVRPLPFPPPPHQLRYATSVTPQHRHLLTTVIALHSNLTTTTTRCSNLRCAASPPPPSWPSPSLWSRSITSPHGSRSRLLRSLPAPSSSCEITATSFIIA